MSTDPESRENYGPYLPSIGSACPSTGKVIPFNDIEALTAAFEAHGSELAAILIEPIQGEAGIVVPSDTYLRDVRALCDKHNVLMICDEIQTGIARTGRLLCHEWSGIKPDLVTLGKAISGGMYPVSCVLGRKDVMLVIEPGTHGSTYGGNPLGCAVAIRALEIVQEENLTERAERLGNVFRDGLKALGSDVITTIRGKGLLNAIVIDESKTNGHSAWDLCMLLKEKGLLVGRALKIAHVKNTSSDKVSSRIDEPAALVGEEVLTTDAANGNANANSTPKAKPTHQNIIRLAPPLVITEDEVKKALSIIAEALKELPTLEVKNTH